MRKTFPLQAPNLTQPRVIDAIKHQVGKYLKRERRKQLPEGADYWDFDCRIGTDRDSASVAHVATLNAAIDTAAREQWTEIYIEILAKSASRTRSPGPPSSLDEAPADAPGD